MRGRVKTVNDEREFGFIIGEDGNEYFFHFSNVISVDFPTKNSIVEFDTSNTEKGYSAKNINVKDIASKRPEIVKFGHVNIVLKNIKMYAIYSGYYEDFCEPTPPCGYREGRRFIDREHLCVQTFQGEKYRFFKDEIDFDIYIKEAELDRYFTM